MKIVENETSFKAKEHSWINFYNKHGWVVIDGALSPEILESTLSEWESLKSRCAEDMGLLIEEYRLEISQWRDLWTNDGTFKELIFGPHLHKLAQDGMGWNGSRLLHDHIICKPYQGSNKKIPWHQDSMFWPVDIPGCSTWTALMPVGLEDGCLEVVDKSHLEGCENPVDFMAKEREEFPEDSVKVRIPIKAGSTILLHSLTWHRSSPNLGDHDRPAHIGLWIHSDAKWRPDLVDWHPVNEHVESTPGSRLVGERFPSFGEIDIVTPPEVDIHSGTIRYNDISMFDASKVVGKQLATISGASGGIVEILSDSTNLDIIISKTIAQGFCDDAEVIRAALNRLWVSYSAYNLHRARNVYNDAYAHWWGLAGSKWNDELMDV